MGHMASWLRIAALLIVLIQLQAGMARAQECSTVGQLYSIDGEVSVQRHGAWQRGVLDQSLCAHDAVRTGSLSRAAVMLINEAVLRIDQDSTVYLVDITADEQKPSLLDLTQGAFQSFSRRPRALEVNTPYLNAAVQGTEFVIRAEAGKTSLTVFEGTVAAGNQHGKISVGSGHSVWSSGGAPHSFVLVRPRDSVQWGLYYPPILAISGSSLKGVRPEFAASAAKAAQHDIQGAFAALEAVPTDQRDAPFYLYQAALLLSVGRVDQARKIIDRAITQNTSAGLAYALRAVIEVVQNDKTAALKDAQLAV
ncbi:MAG: FecR domain-containing protein, partial [Methyloceanibacter sp.]|nr:FecR domain-containing protein [Methyloceanibacter sp.]